MHRKTLEAGSDGFDRQWLSSAHLPTSYKRSMGSCATSLLPVGLRGRAVALLCLLCACSTPIAAALPEKSVSLEHFLHEGFSRANGAPTVILGIAQTPDGYLWLAAKGGLWRYDGFSFERIDAPPGARFAGLNAEALLVTRSGELWVGYGGSGGVAVYRRGHLVDAGMPDPPPHIIRLAEGADSSIFALWGGISRRLWRLHAGRWQLADASMGVPPGYIMDLLPRRDGSLWATVIDPSQTSAGLAVVEPGTRQFAWKGGAYQYPRLAEDPLRRLWVVDRKMARLAEGGIQARTYPLPAGVASPKFAFDQWGGLWLATASIGALRLAGVGQEVTALHTRFEEYRGADGLSSDIARTTFVDREGNIWIGTDKGLDRFRFSDISTVKSLPWNPAEAISFGKSSDGTVFLVVGEKLHEISPEGRLQSVPGSAVSIACASSDAERWFSSPNGLIRLDDRHSKPVPYPNSLPLACAKDARGLFWVVADDRSIWKRDAAGWHRVGQNSDLLLPGAALALNTASDVGYALGSGTVEIAAGGRRQQFALGRLKLGKLQGIDPAGTRFLVPMEDGVARISGGKVAVLDGKEYPWLRQVVTTVTSNRGVTWFFGREGLSLVRTSDLDEAFARPGKPLPHRTFGASEGLPEEFQHAGFSGAQAVEGGDGRLWLATGNGVAYVDPRQVTSVQPAPTVLVRSIGYAGTVIRDPVDTILPAGTTSIQITYAGLQLAAPDRTTFRFRLDGVDAGWVDGGSRRTTNYTNLSPGDYDFHIEAQGESGTWSENETNFHFVIRPTFTQTWAFRLLCIALVLCAFWLLYRLRVNALTANVRGRMAERLDERERIARELHDTLLQSINALILHVQVVTDGLPQEGQARQSLEGALDRAQDAVVEGRESVEALRLPALVGNLEDILVRVAHVELGPYRLKHAIEALGDARQIEPLAANELAQIAKEIFFNVARHASAGRVDVEVIYERRLLTVRFADDGKGMDPDILRIGFRNGHFGLVGMRERVAKLHGKFSIANRRQGGLEVVVALPARVAYRKDDSFWTRLRLPMAWFRR
jgi:two-component sensor histidine kinase